jgi:protein-disulfide isomerase
MRSLLAVVAFLALFAPAVAQNAPPKATPQPKADVDVTQLMIPGPLGDMTLGDPHAPVTVVEYASMTCPHCGRFHSDTFPTLKSKYIDTGKVYFVFREFPLDSLAMAAIMLARCSGPDHFFGVVDTLFDHQQDWAYVADPKSALQSFLMPFGVGPQEFADCLGNDDVFNNASAVAQRGADVFGVQGTPTFFFNGHRVVGEMSVADVDQFVNWAMANGTTGTKPTPTPGGTSTQL